MVENKESQSASGLDFSGLILGFSSAALYYLGQSDIEGKPSSQVNLPLAQQNIDIISMLREKTKGNLSLEEDKLLNDILVDLRDKYQKIASVQS